MLVLWLALGTTAVASEPGGLEPPPEPTAPIATRAGVGLGAGFHHADVGAEVLLEGLRAHAKVGVFKPYLARYQERGAHSPLAGPGDPDVQALSTRTQLRAQVLLGLHTEYQGLRFGISAGSQLDRSQHRIDESSGANESSNDLGVGTSLGRMASTWASVPLSPRARIRLDLSTASVHTTVHTPRLAYAAGGGGSLARLSLDITLHPSADQAQRDLRAVRRESSRRGVPTTLWAGASVGGIIGTSWSDPAPTVGSGLTFVRGDVRADLSVHVAPVGVWKEQRTAFEADPVNCLEPCGPILSRFAAHSRLGVGWQPRISDTVSLGPTVGGLLDLRALRYPIGGPQDSAVTTDGPPRDWNAGPTIGAALNIAMTDRHQIRLESSLDFPFRDWNRVPNQVGPSTTWSPAVSIRVGILGRLWKHNHGGGE